MKCYHHCAKNVLYVYYNFVCGQTIVISNQKFYKSFSNFFHLQKNIYLISTETFDDNF